MSELYLRFSHFNFNAESQWREAAQRYLELCNRIYERELFDDTIDHDPLADNFIPCEVCWEVRELDEQREEFANKFARIWAEKALSPQAAFGEAPQKQASQREGPPKSLTNEKGLVE